MLRSVWEKDTAVLGEPAPDPCTRWHLSVHLTWPARDPPTAILLAQLQMADRDPKAEQEGGCGYRRSGTVLLCIRYD